MDLKGVQYDHKHMLNNYVEMQKKCKEGQKDQRDMQIDYQRQKNDSKGTK